MRSDGLSYAAAGVDIEAYERMLDRVKPLIAATQGPEVVSGVGPFAGLYRLPGGSTLAVSADSVGTKVKVATAYGRHVGIGHDIVNHCVNDVGTAGAWPIFFLDYFASGRLDEHVFSQVVTGLTEACQEAGCALLGGETAEMPGVYGLGDYDLVGFMVGMLEQARDRPPIRAGDLLVGLPSSGLHTNGFSLVRKVFEDVSLDHVFPELGRPLGEALLEPHRSYLPELRSLPWKAAAHITGGGLLGNLYRALPEGLAAAMQLDSWRMPPIFDLIARRGRVASDEMLGTFNMGLGMVLVMDDAPEGLPVVGRVVEQAGGQRVRLTPGSPRNPGFRGVG